MEMMTERVIEFSRRKEIEEMGLKVENVNDVAELDLKLAN